MKKIRITAILLILAMLFGIVPAAGAEAKAGKKDEILYYQATKTLYFNKIGSYVIQIDVAVNRTKKKADVTFTRRDIKQIKDDTWYYYLEEYPEIIESFEKFESNCSKYGHLTADVTYDKFDEGLKTAFELHNLVWDTPKFDVDGYSWNGDSGKYPGGEIRINGWDKVYLGGLGTGYVGREPVADWDEGIGWEFFFSLLDGPPKEKKEYRIKHDNFAFVNEHMAFFNTAPGTAPQRPKIVADRKFADGTEGFLLDDIGYNAMISGRDKNQIAAINIWLNGKWQGSCRGMSIMSGLIFEGKIGLDKVGGAEQTYELKSPKNNRKLSNYIEFYQLISNFERKRFFLQNRGSIPNSEKNAKALVKSLLDNPENPVVVGFNYDDYSSGRTIKCGHAVLAFKAEDTGNDDYKVTVYDPNEPKAERYIYITKDGKASSSWYSHDIYIKPIEKAKDAYNAQMTYPSYPEIPVGYALIALTGGVEMIVGGLTAKVGDGYVSGDLEVVAEMDEGTDETMILVPLENGRTIRIKKSDGQPVSIQTNDITALITGGANEIAINEDGSVTAKNDGSIKDENGENKGTLAVASDKTKSDIFGTTVELGEGEVTIAPQKDGASVTTGDGTGTGSDNKVDITVSGATGSRTFEGIDISEGVDIKSSDNESVLTSGDTEIARGTVEERPIETGDDTTDDPGTDKPGTETGKPGNEPGKDLKAGKGQKKTSVAASVTHKGRKITLNVDMVADKKITYTGKKIKPEDLGYEIDLTDLYNETAVTAGLYKAEDLYKITYVNKNNLHKTGSGKKASFYAKVKLDEDKAKKAGLGDDGITKLKALVKALNAKLKKNPCTYTVQAVKISAKTSKVYAVVTLKGSKISRV
ncbi:MAG: hypothetical protein ILP10_03230, partial [Lachnospiraceae bacterium]|nr:hypothetical protein [Lachnospiraceae bacterium]